MRDLAALRTRLSHIVNFNEGQADQSFAGPSADSNKHIDAAINEAYREEVTRAKQNGHRTYFVHEHSFTWPASARTMAIPQELRGKDIEVLMDRTNASDAGVPITLSDGVTDSGGLYQQDTSTWAWHTAPSAAMTLVARYIADPQELVRSTDVPVLIPEAHRDLIVWSAACIMRQVADEGAPVQWLQRLQELRFQFWKTVSVGKPRQYPGSARIRNFYPDGF